MADTVGLTMGELDRLQVMTRIAERRLTRRKAAALLGVSERQVRRLFRRFQRDGAAGLASRRRGRPSNRRLTEATRERARHACRAKAQDELRTSIAIHVQTSPDAARGFVTLPAGPRYYAHDSPCA